MGIGKDGYYTTDDILKCNATYNFIISGRDAGKSYWHATKNFYKEDNKNGNRKKRLLYNL